MNSLLDLPKDKEQLGELLRAQIQTGSVKRKFQKALWTMTLMYMGGVRDFDVIDYLTGEVSALSQQLKFEDLDFKFEGIIPKYQTEFGRLMQIDIAPVVKRKGAGLDALSKAAIGQVVLDDLLETDNLNLLKSEICKMLLLIGFVGVLSHTPKMKDPTVTLVPPWELGCIPDSPVTEYQISGLTRSRFVSRTWLQQLGLDTKGIDWNNPKFFWESRYKGSSPADNAPSMGLGTLTGSVYGPNLTKEERGKEQAKHDMWGEFHELWVRSEENELLRYVAMVGEVVLVDQDFSESRPPMPLNVCRYVDTGGFYGKGLVEQLVPLNIEIENMLNNLFQNVQDFDSYGITLVSSQMGLNRNQVESAKGGARVMFYTPDPTDPRVQPSSIQPTNSSTLPGSVMQTAMSLLNTQASQSELFSGGAPGRVDSARGLNFLYETANIPLSGPAESISRCIIGCYQSLLWQAKNVSTIQNMKNISVTFDDDILVGIQMDPETGQVTLEQDTIPETHEVFVSIGSKTPKSDAQIKMDLDQNLQMGLITPRTYRILARVRGLDLPLGDDREFQSYRKAKVENVMMYGDGETPGEVIVSDHDYHEVHLEVLEAFMARPEFVLASQAVRDKFSAHRNYHRGELGMYPDPLPYPEEDPYVDAMAQQQPEMM